MERFSFRRFFLAQVAFVVVLVVGTVGFVLLTDEGWTASFYRSVVTTTLTGLDSRPEGTGPQLFSVLLLVSGALGNWLAAAWHGYAYASVGASTALFGAIGALAATEVVRRGRQRRRRAQVWLPLAAGLGLLAMLGTGKGSDFAAHLTGLVSGAAAGALAAWLAPRPPGTAVQVGAGALALAVVAGAWALALR